MIWSEYSVPLTLHDLPARETYIQITASLKALQEAVNGIFARIEGAVDSRRGEHLILAALCASINTICHHVEQMYHCS